MDKIAVLLPCYNEAKTIARVVLDFKAALPDAVIYVYDNNSTDGTDEVARRAGAVVRYEPRQGKGNVVRAMFREIEAECYLMADGDDTYPASHAAELVAPVLAGGADMVVGDRLSTTYTDQNKRRFHDVGNRGVRGAINFLFRSDIKDVMSGYRAFSYLFVKGFPILTKGFEIETEMTIHALDKNFRVAQVPVEYRDRPEGSESKLNTVPDGIKVVRTVVSLFRDYRPMSFFGLLAAFIALFAVAFTIPVFVEYFQTGLVLRFPTLIVTSVMMVIALLLWVCGLLLKAVNKNHRQTYEFWLNDIAVRMPAKAFTQTETAPPAGKKVS